jgi:hypothetical protein
VARLGWLVLAGLVHCARFDACVLSGRLLDSRERQMKSGITLDLLRRVLAWPCELSDVGDGAGVPAGGSLMLMRRPLSGFGHAWAR